MLIPTDQAETNRTVRDVLKDKHPPGQPISPEVIIDGEPPEFHSVVFDQINASLIRSTALKTTGSAGPSGLDAASWRRLCTSFKRASTDLCHSLAATAKRLCTDSLDPIITGPLLSCRLIALNKCPGVRPIGIGNTARRIIAKAILTVTKGDIQEVTGAVQLCAGQICGTETAVHTVTSLSTRRDRGNPSCGCK